MIKVDCLQPIESSVPDSMPRYYFKEDQHTYVNEANVLYATTHFGIVIDVDEDGNEVKNEMTELVDFVFAGGSVVTTRLYCVGVMALLTPRDVQIHVKVPEENENSNIIQKFLDDHTTEHDFNYSEPVDRGQVFCPNGILYEESCYS